MQKIIFTLEGMHCTSCSLLVDDALEDIAGVSSADTDFARAKTTVIFDQGQVSVEQLKTCISELGYGVS